MGYLKELISMEVRQKRCREAWAPHFRECRDLIDKATEGIGHHKVTVLGSGLLLDFSLDLLADTFDKVVLVDILHLPVVQKRVRAFANVELFTNDHTGVAEVTWDHVQQGRTGALPSPAVTPCRYRAVRRFRFGGLSQPVDATAADALRAAAGKGANLSGR